MPPGLPPARTAPWPPWARNRRALLAALAGAGFLVAGAAGWASDGGARADLVLAAEAAALLAWTAGVMAAVRRPPRPHAPRLDGAPLLQAAGVRRHGAALVLLPLLTAAAAGLFTHRDEPGSLLLLGVLAFGALAWLATRPARAFRLLQEGLELRARGRPFALVRFERLREVRVETFKAHAGLVLLGQEGEPSAGVSVWLDGSPELAAALLERAPGAALEGEGVRHRLAVLAAELRRA
ncbi:MAG: hypothetical protein QM767_03440 [Anaeromyxobacter sp.]